MPDILDIGGESTRPGAQDVPEAEENQRTEPVIRAIRAFSEIPVSIDTRKSAVADAALSAGADLVNDVAAMTYDPQIADVAAKAQAPICLMHAQGDPQTMQTAPQYDNVVLDVYDFLESRIAAAEAAGIPRARIMVDPGIGFGKTLEHNLALLQRLSILHSLGCPILLGVSRKRFIGTLADVPEAAAVCRDRSPLPWLALPTARRFCASMTWPKLVKHLPYFKLPLETNPLCLGNYLEPTVFAVKPTSIP